MDFVQELSGCGFVRSVDGLPLAVADEDVADPVGPRGWRLLAGLPQQRVAWLLSGPAAVVFGLVWGSVAAMLFLRPELRPTAEDAVLDLGVLLNLVLLTAVGWLLVLLHEMAHLVAVRATGSSATLDISHRLHLLVAQTDMSSVRALPRRARYAPYLAGMTWDVTLLLGCLVLRAAGVGGPLPGFVGYLLAMSLLFQSAIFLRTDLYYVMTNLLRTGNLMQDTRHWLVNLLCRLVGSAPRHDVGAVPARELRIIRWYSGLVLVGGGAVLAQFLLLGLPLLSTFVLDAAAGLRSGPGSPAFWDGLGLLGVVLLQLGVLAVAVQRERLRRSARETAARAGRARLGGPDLA